MTHICSLLPFVLTEHTKYAFPAQSVAGFHHYRYNIISNYGFTHRYIGNYGFTSQEQLWRWTQMDCSCSSHPTAPCGQFGLLSMSYLSLCYGKCGRDTLQGVVRRQVLNKTSYSCTYQCCPIGPFRLLRTSPLHLGRAML